MIPQFANSREIAKRVLVEGTLALVTPARFGGGEPDDLLDMPLLFDPVEQRALLTGTSIAGALRNYLRVREVGYGRKEGSDSLCVALFGREQGAKEGLHSVLLTHDALSETPGRPATELRDGVAIDPRTRTAEDKKKFDIELLEAGTRFTLRFELLLPEHPEEQQRLLLALAIALQGFERGEIGLGARKRRGLGRCRILGQWTVVEYDLRGRRSDLIAWLKRERPHLKTGSDIATLLGVSERANLDQRSCLTLRATFALEGSLLIRSSRGDLNAPDSVHLHSRRNGKDVPILSGTSLAGALRARALRIVNTLRPDAYQANWELVDALFGVRHTEKEQHSPDKRRTLTASRLVVHETVIQQPVTPELVQSRIKIDRFTGGAYPTALFSEQPVFAKDDTELTLYLELLSPKDYEIGLLLLLLKDLWTGDLPLGGEISVGRGRLEGKSAELRLQRDDGEQVWRISAENGALRIEGDRQQLESFVSEHLRGYFAPSQTPPQAGNVNATVKE
jgi:CRISPR/Cas system CSM-associated protein Csm3 (group 7 of RAMP superfamily)